MNELEHVREVLASLKFTDSGISAVSREDMAEWAIEGAPPASELCCAVTMYNAYDLPAYADPLRGGEYDEGVLHRAIVKARDEGNREQSLFSSAMAVERITHHVLQRGQDPVTLHGPFSQKRAAVKAGLGWIGKSSLFVTPLYGPRVRLFTVLLGIEPPPPAPRVDEACGACRACADACPYGFLSGTAWSATLGRQDLIDAASCSSRMEELGEPIGRKHSCGLCLLACSLGSA